jgi:S-formylglutathione hydrolase FrmB
LHVESWPIDSPAVVVLALLLLVGCNMAVWWPWHASRAIWLGRVVAAGLVPLTVAAAVNTYFAYYPTLGTLLGRTASDQAGRRQLRAVQWTAQHRHSSSSSSSPGSDRVGGPPAQAVSATPLRGAVLTVAIPGVVSHFRARDALVYLPPAWFNPLSPPLPVIMLLAGVPGSPADWTRAGFADVTADRWGSGNGGRGPILVMPDSNGSAFTDTECVNGRYGSVETYLTTDVRDYVIAHFGASADRRSWAVGGLSEGGTCAIHLALRHPQLFSVFMAFGADDRVTGDPSRLFATSPRAAAMLADSYNPRQLLSHQARPPVAGWFEAGNGQGSDASTAAQLSAIAAKAGIEQCLRVLPSGHHTFRVWRQSFADSLPWVMAHLDGTSGAGPVPCGSARAGVSPRSGHSDLIRTR